MKRLFFIFLSVTMTTFDAAAQEPADSLVNQLQDAVVTAKVPVTKLRGTALVSKIAGSPLQHIGTCLDVLRQLPMIRVQADDNAVSVVGKGAPEIYVDGRPLRSQEELVRLQSDNIRTVELEMAPGARYDSETVAVLKITTARSFLNGFSLTDRAEAKFRRRVSAMDMLDLNYRKGAWDFFVGGVYNHDHTVIKGTTANTLVYNGAPAVVGSSQKKDYPAGVWYVEPGLNYAKGALSFGGYYRYNREHADFSNFGSEWFDFEPPVEREIGRIIHAHSHRGSVYFENVFAEKYTLHFDGDYKRSKSGNDNQTSYTGNIYPPVNSSETRTSALWVGKLTLDFPLWRGTCSLGTQDSYTRTTLDYRMHNAEVAEYVPSSLTEARQTALAAFASWSRNVGNLGFSAGLRYEYVDYDFRHNGVRDADVSRRDHLLTPDVSFCWNIGEHAQVSLSYKMRTVKPPYSQLTGSITYAGRHEIEGGNPALRDEHRHSVQLFGSWRDFMMQAVYSRSLDSYGFVKSLYPAPSLQLLMRPVNLDISDFNFYLVWQKTLGVWTPSVTAGVAKQWLRYEGQRYDKPIFAYYFDNTFALPWGIMMTANLAGQSSGHASTNRFGVSWLVMDMSFSKSLWNKSLTLQIAATDLFNTRNNDWTMRTCGVYVQKRQSYDARGISLSLTYRLQPQKNRYRGKAASEEEMNRL